MSLEKCLTLWMLLMRGDSSNGCLPTLGIPPTLGVLPPTLICPPTASPWLGAPCLTAAAVAAAASPTFIGSLVYGSASTRLGLSLPIICRNIIYLIQFIQLYSCHKTAQNCWSDTQAISSFLSSTSEATCVQMDKQYHTDIVPKPKLINLKLN